MSKISYSAWSKWLTCPRMYKLHYVDKIRPVGTSSALVFGLAMDEALNAMLSGRSDYVDVFKKHFELVDTAGIEWSDKDIDADVFTQEQFDKLKGKPKAEWAWATLRVKGRLLLEEYARSILPKIEEVHSVQRSLDGRPGVIDAVVTLSGYGRVLLDHKTAQRAYREGDERSSVQLALYARDQGLTRVGFAVLCKDFIKRTKLTCADCGYDGTGTRNKSCPRRVGGKRCSGDWTKTVAQEPFVQLMVSDVDKILQGLAVESISEVERAIQAGVFPQNLGSCQQYFGKRCPYYGFCRTGDMTGLEVKSEDK